MMAESCGVIGKIGRIGPILLKSHHEYSGTILPNIYLLQTVSNVTTLMAMTRHQRI